MLIPIKDRYPSYGDLKHGKMDTHSLSSNVYTIAPTTYVKGDATFDTRITSADTLNRQLVTTYATPEYLAPHRTTLQDDADHISNRLSELEDELLENGNWRLYSYPVTDAKDRDMHVFSKVANATMDGSNVKPMAVHRVAETNL